MERPEVVTLASIRHPSDAVNRVGFPLDHPYLEECMLPWLGPTSILVLRRLPRLWRDSDPVRMESEALAGTFGVRWGHMDRTLDRIARFGLARRPAPGRLQVFDRCAPLPERILGRQPAVTRDAHRRLIADHLDDLAATTAPAALSPARLPEVRVRPVTPAVPELGR